MEVPDRTAICNCIGMAAPIALPHPERLAAGRGRSSPTTDEVRYGLQHPAHGRVLRFAARLQALVRRPLDPSRLPARRGRPHQCRGLRGAAAGARPPRSGGAALAQPARQGHGRPRRRRRPEELRPRRPLHAGAAIPLPRRARAARRGGEVARALHVDHEHAAAALREAHPRSRLRGAEARLYRPDRLGFVRSQDDDAEQPGPAGDPPAGRQGQRADGHAADQLQGARGSTTTSRRRSCASSRRTSTPRASTRRKARSSCR